MRDTERLAEFHTAVTPAMASYRGQVGRPTAEVYDIGRPTWWLAGDGTPGRRS